MELKVRNVNEAFYKLVETFAEESRNRTVPVIKKDSRNGKVLMIDEPVTITYSHPRERVLFNIERDANPFFHLYEALWMLAGRNDVESVAYYAKQMREYSDDGKRLNGAYGYRWRKATVDAGLSTHVELTSVDQLDVIVAHLKTNPTSRRAVLSMWNVEDDLLKIGGYGNRIRCKRCYGTGGVAIASQVVNDQGYDVIDCPNCKRSGWEDEPSSKDVCCNLNVMFSIREGERVEDEHKYHPHTGTFYTTKKYLDMTVTNRSNDLIWGLLGANYVHFTFLQEYLAARLGVEVGKYHHFTNNLHAYEWNWKPKEWLEGGYFASYTPISGAESVVKPGVPINPSPSFEEELPYFVKRFGKNPYGATSWNSKFLQEAQNILLAYHYGYKNKSYSTANVYLDRIESEDWRIAAKTWLERRVK